MCSECAIVTDHPRIRSPDEAKIKEKMVYASSRDALKRALVGIAVEIQGTEFSEVAYESGVYLSPSLTEPFCSQSLLFQYSRKHPGDIEPVLVPVTDMSLICLSSSS